LFERLRVGGMVRDHRLDAAVLVAIRRREQQPGMVVAHGLQQRHDDGGETGNLVVQALRSEGGQ
jgi:hypothetical protein